MQSYNIHFIRHGACEESRKGIYVGTKDYPLSIILQLLNSSVRSNNRLINLFLSDFLMDIFQSVQRFIKCIILFRKM